MLFDLNKAISGHLTTSYNKFLKDDVLFDTGPFFLYLLGNFDEKHRTNLLRIFNYTINDYHLLLKMIHLFKKSHVNFVITPHILHELIKHIQDDCKKSYPDKRYCDILLSQVTEFIKPILQEVKEIYTEKNNLINHPYFLKKWEIGDLSIEVVDKDKNECSIILTDDSKIKEEYESEEKRDVLIIYFTDIKNNAGFFV